MVSIFSNTAQNNPLLIKNGDSLSVSIISNGSFPVEVTQKDFVHKTVGNEDIYEFIGDGEDKLKVKFYFEIEDDYQDFIDFVKGGTSLMLSCSFYPLVPLKVVGSINVEKYYRGWGVATVNFTTAKDPNSNDFALLNYASKKLGSANETPNSKKDTLSKLQDWGKKVYSGVSKSNEFVGSVTNNVAAYSAAITNSLNGLASGSSIITNPINSIKSSVSQITGGLSSVISALQTVKNAINQIPDDIDRIVDTFSQLGDQLNNLFDLGDQNESLKYNTLFLEETALAIINIDISNDNPAIINQDDDFTATENFLTSVSEQSNSTISVLTLVSILLNIYENAESINRWNALDLERLRKRTETIYYYVVSFDLSSDLRLTIDLSRNSFFKIYEIIYANAYKTIEIKIDDPTFLADIVYSVNGNLDFFDETKQLNNIIGSIVTNKTILVVSND